MCYYILAIIFFKKRKEFYQQFISNFEKFRYLKTQNLIIDIYLYLNNILASIPFNVQVFMKNK